MKSLSEAADKAARDARHRQWRWCRRPNGFSDKPLWRVIAAQLDLPLPFVLAFANRLEELANAADPRGYVGDFSPAEFGAALGISAADAARIFAALQDPDIGWVHQDHVLTFYERNPDKEDGSAAERKRRSRSFKAALRQLAEQAALGHITTAERRDCERAVFALQQQARGGLLTESELHRLLFELVHPPPERKSTGHAGHVVTDPVDNGHAVTNRDIVTVTPRAEHTGTGHPVDNSGAAGRRPEKGPSEDGASGQSGGPQAEATAWLQSTGCRIVTERMEIEPGLAATKVERWLHQELEGDAVALREVIEAADRADYMGARFHNLVVDGYRRRRQRQPPLPLPPALTDKRGAA